MTADDFNDGFALTIGTPFNVSTTANDSQAMFNVLVDDHLCAYPTEQVTRLLPAEATRRAIRKAFNQLANATNANSTVVIFYSGHGELGPDGKFYIAPTNGDLNNPAETCISGAELARRVQKIAARKLMVILDCCHAGAAELADQSIQLARAPLPAAPPLAPPYAPGAPDGLAEGSGRVVLAASQAGEHSSSDFPLSVFTQAVVLALSGAGKTSTGGFVRLSDVIRFTCSEVGRATGKLQNPIFISSGSTDFPVARFSGPPQPFDPDQVGAVLNARELLPPAEPGEDQASVRPAAPVQPVAPAVAPVVAPVA